MLRVGALRRSLRQWVDEDFSREPQRVTRGDSAGIEGHLQDGLDDLFTSGAEAERRLDVRAQLRHRESQSRGRGDQQKLADLQIQARTAHDAGDRPLDGLVAKSGHTLRNDATNCSPE